MNLVFKKTVAIDLLNLLETFINSSLHVDAQIYNRRILRKLNENEKHLWITEIVPKYHLNKNDYLDTILNSGAEKFILTLLSIAEEFKAKYVPEKYIDQMYNWEDRNEDEYSDIKKALLYKIRNSQNLPNSVRHQAGLFLIQLTLVYHITLSRQ